MSDLCDRLRNPAWRSLGPGKAEPDYEKLQAERMEAADKIETDAKVIAALREAFDTAINMLEESHSGYISGSRTDLEWDADRERVIEAGRIALAGGNEQNVGK